MSYRVSKLGYWLKLLVKLKPEESTLKKAMSPDAALILQNKNILLWKSMLQSLGYADMGVVDKFISGSDLVGYMDQTGFWPLRFQPAVITENELHDIAERERPAIATQFSGSIDNELAAAIWEKTLEEADLGILEGPLYLSLIPSNYPLSRRFGIRQSGKIRYIDNFSRSSVNRCVQTYKSPRPHTIDVFGSLYIHAMSVETPGEKWRGRTFDLKGAYR